MTGAASELNPHPEDSPVETALVGDERPKRGARLEAERRLAGILPGEPGATVAPPPGLEPVEAEASETGEMETLAPTAPPIKVEPPGEQEEIPQGKKEQPKGVPKEEDPV